MSRADMRGGGRIYEIDWAPKWAEGVGQAAWYSAATGDEPVLVLLVTDRRQEARHLYRAAAACARVGVRLEIEEVTD